ncbi:TOMM precursor leader peptide-binding protein [Nocardia nova]|uniref:TOMM precursor leader peptide-binding protein n=1 Tax=Nocardia nova TaxID=37330 RepID=UPI0034012454
MRFARYFDVRVVPGDAVYLTSERSGQTRLPGPLAEKAAPYLLGGHDRGDIVDQLAGTSDPSSIDSVLTALRNSGKIVDADPDQDCGVAGYWEAAGVDGDTAIGTLRSRTVGIRTVGAGAAELEAAAAALGLETTVARPDLTIVPVDDYLDPELEQINRTMFDSGAAWMPVKTAGTVVWIGPIFEPGESACWDCMAVRMRSNRMVDHYLKQRHNTKLSFAAVTGLPTTRAVAADLAILQAAKWLGGVTMEPSVVGRRSRPLRRSELITFDTIEMTTGKHILTRRPQCPVCGDAELQARLHRIPLAVGSVPKAVTADGGHRATSPEDMVAEFEPLVSSITGPIKQLVKMKTARGIHAYTSGQNFAIPMADISDLRAGLRSASAGKGMTDVQAKASALGEAIERLSGIYCGDEARIAASYRELDPGSAIAPNELHLFSEKQFAHRSEWNARGAHFERVCDPFDAEQRIDWTPVWSLTRSEFRYIPTASLFYGYPMRPGNVYSGADSNGNAAGTSIEDAIVQGFMELVERDSVGIWWYNRLSMPRIDLESFDEPYFGWWTEAYRKLGRETWVLDVTADLGIPAVVAVSRRFDKPVEDILIAFGAHFDVHIAISRAMSEMNQFVSSVADVEDGAEGTGGPGDYNFTGREQLNWWMSATIENQPYLAPVADRVRTAADYTNMSTDDLGEDVRVAQRLVEGAGLEMLVLNQTRPDIDLPVVKVIVPGMRPFWTRFAPGRLYDVPVAMGWLREPTAEDDLNPVAMFL